MSKDLISQLVDAEDDLARSLPPADDAITGHIRSAAGRRRRARHVREVAGGLAAVVVLGTASWAVAGTLGSPTPPVTAPAVSTPSPTPTPTPTPAPPAEVEPEDPGPVVRQDVIDDPTVLSRLREPRTGEVWTTPERAPDMDATFSHESNPLHAWRVGHRGDASIYLVVDGQEAAAGEYNPLFGLAVAGVYEVDESGVREIACPSARTTDPCVERGIIAAEAVLDEDTFYDTMTLPAQIDLGDDWSLTTAVTTGQEWFHALGEAEVLYDVAGQVETVRDLGGIQVVEVVQDGSVPGLDDRRYGLRLPVGTILPLDAGDTPAGRFRDIRWDDGVTRDAPDGVRGYSSAPGRGMCFSGTFSVEVEHVPGQWRPAGTAPGGHRVYVPRPGNTTATTVRAWHEEMSWTYTDDFGYVEGTAAGYPYPDDESFLAAHALYAVQGPDGQWQLRLRPEAVQIAYECA